MTLVPRAVSWSADRVKRLLGFVYYEFFFDTRSSVRDALASRVQTWEEQRGKGDSPIPKTLWEEREYESWTCSVLVPAGISNLEAVRAEG